MLYAVSSADGAKLWEYATAKEFETINRVFSPSDREIEWARGVVEAFEGRIAYALTSYVDHKTELQEELARRGRQVSYSVLDVKGPPHDRTFTCAAVIDGEEAGVGKGRSKKAAEQAAARQALDRLVNAA